MIVFNPISINNLRNGEAYKNVIDYFPFSKKYIDSYEFGDKKYEWFFITDDSLRTDVEKNTWLGIVCLTENKYVLEDNLHLSVIEVASPIKGLNIGTRILNRIIDIGVKNYYNTLTLQIQDKELLKFYVRFGFTKDDNLEGDTYILYL